MDQLSGPIFYSVYGLVKYCCYSTEFSIDFGDMQVSLCHERLRRFARRVNQLVRTNGPLHRLPLTRQIDVYPPSSHAEFFRFDADELLDLQTLLNGSLVMIDLYQFLSDNQFQLETNPK